MTTHAPFVLPKKKTQGTRQDSSSPGGDASEEMEMGRHFHIPAETVGFFLRCGLFPWRLHDSPLYLSLHDANSIGYVFSS